MQFERKHPEKKISISDLETQEGQAYVTYLYRDCFMTDEQVSKELGISRRTLFNWIGKSEIIKRARNNGKEFVDTIVENALLANALKGNVRAQELWLYNRKPQIWRPYRDYTTHEEDEAESGLNNFLKATGQVTTEDVSALFADENKDAQKDD